MNNTIVITGLLGSGSTTTSRSLAKELGFDYFSVGQLFKDIANGSIKDKHYYSLFKKICLKRGLDIPAFQSVDDSHGAINLWNTEFGKSKELHSAIDELQVTLAEKGKIVIDAKLGIYHIPQANLKIWLTASLEVRAKRTSKRDNVPIDEAISLIKLRDEKQRLEWKKIYGVDYHSQKEKASLIINTSFVTLKETTEKIMSYIRDNNI